MEEPKGSALWPADGFRQCATTIPKPIQALLISRREIGGNKPKLYMFYPVWNEFST